MVIKLPLLTHKTNLYLPWIMFQGLLILSIPQIKEVMKSTICIC